MFVSLLIWNVVLAALLAVVISLVGLTRYMRERPAFRHWLWLIVLCKLVTPPLLPLPVLTPPNLKTSRADTSEQTEAGLARVPVAGERRVPRSVATLAVDHLASSPSQNAEFTNAEMGESVFSAVMNDGGDNPQKSESSAASSSLIDHWFAVLCSIWLAVALVLMGRVFIQLRRLTCLLRRGDWENIKLNEIVRRDAKRMGIRQLPGVCVVRVRVTPMLWVMEGQPVVVLPYSLLSELTDEQISYVATHELAHYLRRDHWSNGLACIVGCLFWWNPVLWWTQRELKVAQEACCDAIVIDRAPSIRRSYAETLLHVVDYVGAERSVPQLVSGFGDTPSIERRFEMIANTKVTHRMSWTTCAMVVSTLITACCYPVLAQSPTKHQSGSNAGPQLTASDAPQNGDRVNDSHASIRSEPHLLAEVRIQHNPNTSDSYSVSVLIENLPSEQIDKIKARLSKETLLVFRKKAQKLPGSNRVNLMLTTSGSLTADSIDGVVKGLRKHLDVWEVVADASLLNRLIQADTAPAVASEERTGRPSADRGQSGFAGGFDVVPDSVFDGGFSFLNNLGGLGNGSSRDGKKQPHSLLHGEWLVVDEQHGLGKGPPRELEFDSYLCQFDDVTRTITTQWRRGSKTGGGENRYTIDTSVTPHLLTIYGENMLIQAIWIRTSDELIIAHFGRSEFARPVSFEDDRTNAGPLVIRTLERPGKDADKHPSGKQSVLKTKAFQLKYADAANVEELVSALALKSIRINTDRRMNRVTVTGSEDHLTEISELVEELDRNTPSTKLVIWTIRKVDPQKAALIVFKTFVGDDKESSIKVNVAGDQLLVRGASEKERTQIQNLLTSLEWLNTKKK